MVVGLPGGLGAPAVHRAAEDQRNACAAALTQFQPMAVLPVRDLVPSPKGVTKMDVQVKRLFSAVEI